MKKILFSMVALMSTVATMAQVITFERTEHDFGKINEADGRVRPSSVLRTKEWILWY